ncbi:hypothetical protein C0J52_20621 [Blattella germanica]|nr:hypothetical protein C0J52_20621 [Blattella germanica]
MTGEMFGKRPVGKPKKIWIDSVKEIAYQILICRNWQLVVQDREDWRTRKKKVQARFGL